MGAASRGLLRHFGPGRRPREQVPQSPRQRGQQEYAESGAGGFGADAPPQEGPQQPAGRTQLPRWSPQPGPHQARELQPLRGPPTVLGWPQPKFPLPRASRVVGGLSGAANTGGPGERPGHSQHLPPALPGEGKRRLAVQAGLLPPVGPGVPPLGKTHSQRVRHLLSLCGYPPHETSVISFTGLPTARLVAAGDSPDTKGFFYSSLHALARLKERTIPLCPPSLRHAQGRLFPGREEKEIPGGHPSDFVESLDPDRSGSDQAPAPSLRSRAGSGASSSEPVLSGAKG